MVFRKRAAKLFLNKTKEILRKLLQTINIPRLKMLQRYYMFPILLDHFYPASTLVFLGSFF